MEEYSVNLINCLADPSEDCQGCVACLTQPQEFDYYVMTIMENGELSLDCERTFFIRQVLEGDQQTIPFVRHKSSCIICISLRYEDNTQCTTASLDSGAQLSTISRKRLDSLFPNTEFKFDKVNVILKSAGNDQIKCLGSITLECKIGNAHRKIQFYVIEGTDTILLSYPDMGLFNLILDTSQKSCTVHSITAISNEEITDCMLFQPLYMYLLIPDKIQYIELRGIPRDDSFLNNCQVDIFFCDCVLRSKKRILCEDCQTNGPLCSLFLTTLEITIPFKGQISSIGKKDCFQAVRSHSKEQNMINVDELMADQEMAQPAGNLLQGGEVHLEAPAILGQNPGLKVVSEIPQTCAIDLQEANRVPKCAFCSALNSSSFYCDLSDPRCYTYRSFKEKILGPKNPICSITEVATLTESMMKVEVIFIQMLQLEKLTEELNLSGLKDQLEEFKWKLLKTSNNSDLYQVEEDGYTLYICIFKRFLYFDGLSLLNKILIKCQERKWKKISFINYHSMGLSQRGLNMIFQDLKIDIFLLTPTQREINKIEKESKAFIEETQDQENMINKLNLSQEGKTELKRIFKEVSEAKDGLQSVFSANSLDCNYFHSAEFPHVPFVFDFQWKPEAASYIPIRERCRYVNPSIKDNVTEMIQKLLYCGVIYSGYSPYNAQSIYVKKKVDKTMEEHLAEGGTPDTFIPGTISEKKSGVRHTVDYAQINSLQITAPLNQDPPLSQLRSIAADTKYITSLDACSMYYTLKLSKSSCQYTGFNSGLRDIALNDLMYGCTPMGASNSVIFQNCALTHSLAGIRNVKLWADNILIYDGEEKEHIQRIGKVLRALKSNGLKIKLSKAVLCVTDKIAIYGFTLSLPDLKIYPNSDKLAALKTKEKPNSIKELKSLLGSLGFFRSFTPCIQQSLSILSEMTRKGQFKWSDKTNQAYEDVMILLSHPHLIFIHRSDHTKPIYGIVDSSLQMSAFIIYQKDEQNRPRVLEYNTRVLSARESNFPPILAELHGLCSLISSLQEQYGYHQPGITIFSDSRPLILICNSSHYNTRLARMKIYLSSLGWLKVDYQQGKSELIQVADYFSRDQNSTRKFCQKLPDKEELEKVERVSKKFAEDQVLTIKESFFLMDYLLSKTESDLDNIRDNSCLMQNKEIVFQTNQDSTVKKGPRIMSKEEGTKEGQLSEEGQVISGKEGQEECEGQVSVNQVITRGQAMRQMLKNVREASNEPQPNIFRCLAPLRTSTDTVETSNRTNKINKTGFQGFYENFLENTFLLDKEGFINAQRKDPHYADIIQKCKTRGEIRINEKVYFLHQDMLFCKIRYCGVTTYKVILPLSLAYDVLCLLHRQRGHVRASKLLHLSQLYFEYKNADQLTKHICQQCWQCTFNAPITNRKRCDLPKQKRLLNGPRKAIYVDELLIFQNEHMSIKILNFTCLFSHHITIRFIEGDLKSDFFCTSIMELKCSLGGDLQYIVTDGASTLNSALVHDTCAKLGLTKLITSAYQPRGNIAELLNKLILQLTRQLAAEHCATPGMVRCLVTKAVECINSTNFSHSKHLSPHCLYFGSYPSKDFFDCLQLREEEFPNKLEYFKATLLLQKFLRDIRHSYLRARAEETEIKASQDRNHQIKSKIVVGDYVTIINRHRTQGGRNKIFSNYTNLYEVLGGSDSLLYLAPCHNRRELRSPGKRVIVLQVDRENVKKVKPPITVDTSHNYFQNFGETNYVPKPLYIENEKIDTFEKLMRTDMDVHVIDRLISYINTPEVECPRESILTSFRKSQRQYMLREIKKVHKKVCWEETVRTRRFADLNNFTYWTTSEVLKEEQKSRIKRFLKTGGKIHSCDCQRCAKEQPHCYMERCERCEIII